MQHLMIWKDERTKRYEKNENPEKPKPKIMQLPPPFFPGFEKPECAAFIRLFGCSQCRSENCYVYQLCLPGHRGETFDVVAPATQDHLHMFSKPNIRILWYCMWKYFTCWRSSFFRHGFKKELDHIGFDVLGCRSKLRGSCFCLNLPHDLTPNDQSAPGIGEQK